MSSSSYGQVRASGTTCAAMRQYSVIPVHREAGQRYIEITKDSHRLLGRVAHKRSDLSSTPPLTPSLESLLRSREQVEPELVADQVDEVLETRTHPAPADGEVQLRQETGMVPIRPPKKVRHRPTFSMNQRLSIPDAPQLEQGLVDGTRVLGGVVCAVVLDLEVGHMLTVTQQSDQTLRCCYMY